MEARTTITRASHEPLDDRPIQHVFSIGSHCVTSAILKDFGLKRESGPFDWIFSSLGVAAHCIGDQFSTFLNKELLHHVPVDLRQEKDFNFCDNIYYRDHFGIRFMFNHYDASVPEHYDYYTRCVDRFMGALMGDQRTLLVSISKGPHDMGFGELCRSLIPYPNAEALVFCPTRSSQGNSDAVLVQTEGRHKHYSLLLNDHILPVSFASPDDEATVKSVISQYRFDLGASQ